MRPEPSESMEAHPASHPYGMLRAAHSAYLFRRNLMQLMSIGFERASLGAPVNKEPAQEDPDAA